MNKETPEIEKEVGRSMKKEEGKLLRLKLKDIKPYKNNAKIHTEKQVMSIMNSIVSFGYKDLIAVDENNLILEGHGRLRALYMIDTTGQREINVWQITDFNEDEKKSYRIAHNKIGMDTGFDDEILKVEFEGMQKLEFTGFTEAQIDRILDPVDKISLGNKEPKYEIKLGDVYQLGEHRIICGDSTKEETYLKLIPEGVDIQMIFTDPPYGVSYSGTNNPNGRSWDVIEGDNMRGDELFEMLYGCFKQINQVLAKNGAMYVFHASSNQIIFEQALTDSGFQVKQQLIWAKHHILGHSHYHWCHEPMFYCSRMKENPEYFGTRCNKTTLNKIVPEEMTIEELRKFVNKIKEQSTIWEIKKDSSKNYIHPTQKPTKLAERAMLNSSKIGQCILDPFAGSGSTLMACEERKRICYTIELDPDFCSHIIERWENSTGNKGVKL